MTLSTAGEVISLFICLGRRGRGPEGYSQFPKHVLRLGGTGLPSVLPINQSPCLYRVQERTMPSTGFLSGRSAHLSSTTGPHCFQESSPALWNQGETGETRLQAKLI